MTGSLLDLMMSLDDESWPEVFSFVVLTSFPWGPFILCVRMRTRWFFGDFLCTLSFKLPNFSIPTGHLQFFPFFAGLHDSQAFSIDWTKAFIFPNASFFTGRFFSGFDQSSSYARTSIRWVLKIDDFLFISSWIQWARFFFLYYSSQIAITKFLHNKRD